MGQSFSLPHVSVIKFYIKSKGLNDMNKKIIRFIYFIFMFAFIFLFSCENKELKYIEKNKTEDTIEIPFEFTESDDEPTDNYNLMLGWNILGFSDGYIYFVNGSSNPFNLQENQTLWKYNIKTNNLTSVCSDPICKHNTPR